MSKKIITKLFNYAAREGAKGLVIEGVPEKIALNYHFDGGEERSFALPKKLEKDLSLALRQILKIAPDELTTKKYCKIEDNNYRLNFYLTIIPSQYGEKIIINIIPKSHKLLSLKQLGLSRENLKLLETFIHRRSGLVLISSPHGQGKHMTMYALLQELNNLNRSAYYLGGKLAYKFEGVNNLEANKNNWRKLLSIDSEIIACEINTPEDFINASQAASTGRLVIAVVAANSVWEVLLAYLKLKLPLKLKLDSLKLILNQRLAPLTRKKSGRQKIGLFEVLEMTPKIKEYLIETAPDKTKDKFWEKLGRLALSEGYRPLSFDHQDKINNGLIKSK